MSCALMRAPNSIQEKYGIIMTRRGLGLTRSYVQLPEMSFQVMSSSDRKMSELIENDTSKQMEQIQSCALETQALLEFGGYKENHYQRVLIHFLQKAGFNVSSEETLAYKFKVDGEEIFAGFGRIDLRITKNEETYILELKVAKNLNYLSDYRQQLHKYLRHYPSQATGVIIVFFNDKPPRFF